MKWLTTTQLLVTDWFPIKTKKTLYEQIKSGKLKATNIGEGKERPRYVFLKDDVIKFLVNREDWR